MKSTRTLAGQTVSSVGLGCMNLSHAYGSPPPKADAISLIHRAIDLGCNLFDTAALYGFGTNEMLVGEALRPYRDQVMLCSKGGMAGVQFDDGVKRVIDGRPETLRKNCEDSLTRLGVDVIDLYYLHRWDKKVPIEDSIGALSDLHREGKIQAIGLSEVSATTLRQAHAVHPIAAVQTEYSLWTRNPEIAVLDACDDLGVTFVAFSPLARGYLGAQLRDVSTLQAQDIRRFMPRFSPEMYEKNLALLHEYEKLAQQAQCTPAQLALAWLLHKHPGLIALPGTQNIQHLQDNLASAQVRLSEQQMQALEALINQQTVAGERYNPLNSQEVDTETFA